MKIWQSRKAGPGAQCLLIEGEDWLFALKKEMPFGFLVKESGKFAPMRQQGEIAKYKSLRRCGSVAELSVV